MVALSLCASAVIAAPDIDGARVGVWTQDYDAAVALAKTNNLPLMLNFTGSDWCGWCKLMDRQVFSTEIWQKWAKDNIVLAFIDFPNDKSLVPEKYVARNKNLAGKYGIRGYPTYVLVDPATENALDTLGASRDATPKAFIKDVKRALFMSSPSDIAKRLPAQDVKTYEKLKAEVDKVSAEYDDYIKTTGAELQLLNQVVKGAKDDSARKKAEKAFKKRYEEISKEAEKISARKAAAEKKLSVIIDKAMGTCP